MTATERLSYPSLNGDLPVIGRGEDGSIGVHGGGYPRVPVSTVRVQAILALPGMAGDFLSDYL
jgi:hypothetical protein